MNKITSINGTLVAPLNKLNEHVENKTAHVTEEERAAWNAQTTIKAKGILIATQEDLDEHVGNSTIHLTEEERTTWNNKADAFALSSKVDTSAFNAHENDTVVHVTDAERQRWNATPELDESNNMTLAGGLTVADTVNANGGISAVSTLVPGLTKTGLNAGAAAVMEVLGNVYHLDHVNSSTLTTLDGSNVKVERALAGWCGLSWMGTNTAHKCVLVKSAIPNTNYGGAVSPMGTSNYALVMSYLSGVNMATTSTKFGWTGYYKSISATAIEDIPGPVFYVDAASRKMVAKSATGETMELPWPDFSMEWVSRLDLIAVPSSFSSSTIYLAKHTGVSAGYGTHYNFNRRYLVPQVYRLGEVALGLVSNDVNYAVVDTCSEQMALFRISVIQGINIEEYLNMETL